MDVHTVSDNYESSLQLQTMRATMRPDCLFYRIPVLLGSTGFYTGLLHSKLCKRILLNRRVRTKSRNFRTLTCAFYFSSGSFARLRAICFRATRCEKHETLNTSRHKLVYSPLSIFVPRLVLVATNLFYSILFVSIHTA